MRGWRFVRKFLGGDDRAAGSVDVGEEDRLSVCIVGCGEVVKRNRAAAIDATPGLDLSLLVDTREWAAREIAESFEAEHTTDYDDALADGSIDLVYVATPHHLHAEQGIRAAEAGKHVIVEKPLATTVSDCADVVEACDRAGVVLSVSFPSRFDPEVQRARQLVREGVVGSIIGTRIETMSHLKTDSFWKGGYSGRIESEWRASRERSGGGILVMTNVHDLDRMRYVTGLEPARIYCEHDNFDSPSEVEDFAALVMRYENGAIGTLEASSAVDAVPDDDPGYRNKIYGENGVILVDDPLKVRTKEPTSLGAADRWHEVDPGDANFESPVISYFHDVATAIRNGTAPTVTGEDGKLAVEIVTAAYESGGSGDPVEFG